MMFQLQKGSYFGLLISLTVTRSGQVVDQYSFWSNDNTGSTHHLNTQVNTQINHV